MSLPEDRKYALTHEWYKTDGNIVTVGITQFAADELTDITYVDLPATGTTVVAGKAVGEIESVKATSELFSAVGGTIVEANATLVEKPEIINEDAFASGWLVKVACDDLSPLDDLLDAAAYAQTLLA